MGVSLMGEALRQSDVDVPDPSSPTFDWEISARVDFGVDPKQELLAMTSPRRRMVRRARTIEADVLVDTTGVACGTCRAQQRGGLNF